MVFSSFPLYLDPPANSWNQQQVQLPGGDGSGTDEAPQLPRPLGPVPPRADVQMAGMMRPPGSMAGRARLAKLEQTALKCPRCDSTNTKFCYFNNYSLSQPRHFCKTCRRYWTHGGALRNVPVGGSCRRSTKRTKPAPGGGSSSHAGLQSGGAGASSSVAVAPQQQPPRHLLPDRGAPGSSFTAGMETLDQPAGLENLRFDSPMILSGLEPAPPPLPSHPHPSLAPILNPYSSYIVGDGSDLDGFGGRLESNSKAPSSGLLMQQLTSVKTDDNERSRLPPYFWGGGSGGGSSSSGGGGWATTGFSGLN